ncbi:5-(carboxyamino)imidazole ribonucleotide mutase [Propionivibrio sp.]|uniref:5-(carboxyamino)imidazole ribonucleotide mutase n=1 Tax=Propionivibrio sp. TaxID=2212460 RepID=UPI003BF06F64
MDKNPHSHPLVGIVMGSDSDWPVMRSCAEMLKNFGILYEAKVLSAHRTPDAALDYAACAQERGIKVLIGAAGGAAHLAGVLAAKSELPVLAVPMPSKHLQGLDSLLAMVQMPGGIPVATFAIGEAGAVNAALFSVAMLALNDRGLAKKLTEFRTNQSEKVLSKTLPDLP